MRSPGFRPALEAGPPGSTMLTLQPGSPLVTVAPKYTFGKRISCFSVSDFTNWVQLAENSVIGTWKLSAGELLIALWMAITRPYMSKSGPPESPGLIVQSVCKMPGASIADVLA